VVQSPPCLVQTHFNACARRPHPSENHLRRNASFGRSRSPDLLLGLPDDVRLSDIETRFTCQACGIKGADVRPNFHLGSRCPTRLCLHWLSQLLKPMRSGYKRAQAG